MHNRCATMEMHNNLTCPVLGITSIPPDSIRHPIGIRPRSGLRRSPTRSRPDFGRIAAEIRCDSGRDLVGIGVIRDRRWSCHWQPRFRLNSNRNSAAIPPAPTPPRVHGPMSYSAAQRRILMNFTSIVIGIYGAHIGLSPAVKNLILSMSHY